MEAQAQEKPLILVVDDHDSQRELFKLLADRLHIDVHVVDNGEDALEAASTYVYDGILMDVMMPKMDGYECTRRIRAFENSGNKGHVPIIAVTACVMPGDREKCLDSGMDDYLAKPFTLEDLKSKLDTWVPGRGFRNTSK